MEHGFVRGGNLCKIAGIMSGENIIIPDHVYDMSILCDVVRTDGNYWFVDEQKIEEVRSGRSAAVFEIGRLIVEEKKPNCHSMIQGS
nr:DUF6710 family protein [Klebsiella aerogenes]